MSTSLYTQSPIPASMETPMPVMSLQAEFEQYQHELKALEVRIQSDATAASSDSRFTSSLLEINHTLSELNQFKPEGASSSDILSMADRANTLIELISLQCVRYGVQ